MKLWNYSIEHFLLTILGAESRSGELTELLPATHFKPNSFIVLPYQNPQTNNLQPLFFDIVSKKEIKIDLDTSSQKPILLHSKIPKEKYIQNLIALKEQIQQGNIYEINYCIEFFAEDVEIDPVSIFLKLNEISKAPYAAFVKLNDDFIISASPELFLKKEGNTLYTKPIKRAAKRGKNKEEDDTLKNNLFNNLKERTENVMAVDVARSNISQVAKKGSVHVNKLYNIETFETVHQMVSTVSCEIKEHIHSGVLEDQIIELTVKDGQEMSKLKLRKVCFYDRVLKREFEFLTNLFKMRADLIAAIYKLRWQIELLFKQLKQNFPLRYFLGDNENAIKIQIYCALIANLLITVIQKQLKRSWAFSNLVSFCKIHLFNYINLIRFLENPNKDWPKIFHNQEQFSLF